MSMHNLLEYCDSYSMTSANLWSYYRGEVNDNSNENVNDYSANNSKTRTSRTFECKTKTVGIAPANNDRLNTYCEIVIDLSWTEDLDLALI